MEPEKCYVLPYMAKNILTKLTKKKPEEYTILVYIDVHQKLINLLFIIVFNVDTIPVKRNSQRERGRSAVVMGCGRSMWREHYLILI